MSAIALFLIFLVQFSVGHAQNLENPTKLASSQNLEKGRVLLKVEDQIYFDWEVLELIKIVNAFVCAFPESYLESLFEWKPKKMVELTELIRKGAPRTFQETTEFYPILLSLKLLTSVKRAPVVVLDQTRDLYFKSLKEHKCLTNGEIDSFRDNLKGWLSGEVFLRARFVGKEDGKNSDKESPLSLETKRQALRASWEAQYPHQIFLNPADAQ